MRAVFSFLIFLFSISISKAQITDSTRIQKTPIHLPQKSIDTSFVKYNFSALDIDMLYFSKKVIIKDPKVYISKSLLDSLLKPYYFVNVDSVTQETIYRSKLRASVNAFTRDTSYIPFPKAKNPIFISNSFGIDTLISLSLVRPKDSITDHQVRDLAWWENVNSIEFDLHEVAFMNWTSGGENSISGLLKIYFSRTFQKEYTLWKTEVYARYGLNKQQERELRKTDDEIRINSTFGFRHKENSNWYHTAKLNFRTQFTKGYKYPNIDDPISMFFAPAYLFVGVGAQYNIPEKHFFVYLSPVTFKSTFVMDETLSNEGAYGVDPGKKIRREFGASIQSQWDTEIFKNVAMINRLGLYTDYFNNFGNIDVDWDLIFKFKISEYFEANLGVHLIYDDDIKFGEDSNGDGEIDTYGARVQLKQEFGVGVLYKF